MTLTDVLPTLRSTLQTRLDPTLWPRGTTQTTAIEVGGVSLADIATRFGTPCQVLSEADVRRRCREFTAALPDAEIAFASKSLCCRAVLRWVAAEGLSVDVCSGGELAVARAAGVPGSRIILHGNVKTDADLTAALTHEVGRIVVDSFDEIERLAALVRRPQRVLVRVTPGIDGHTHAAIATAVEDQKFGFALRDGAAAAAVRQVLSHPGLVFSGLHCHIGSQITRVSCYEEAVRRLLGLASAIRDSHGVTVSELDLGGGFAVPYVPGEAEFDLAGYANRVAVAVHDECARHRIPLPRMTVEPGRSIVANAGVTVYRVVTVKHGPVRTFVSVDGGMSDNPRPALYGARYTARLAGRVSTAPDATATVVGRHCEAGDILAADVPLPSDIRAGDLLAIPVTGAYHHSLASNYNQVGRPPVVAVAGGAARLVVRRETEEDLLSRDMG